MSVAFGVIIGGYRHTPGSDLAWRTIDGIHTPAPAPSGSQGTKRPSGSSAGDHLEGR